MLCNRRSIILRAPVPKYDVSKLHSRRAFATSFPRLQDVFHSQLEDPAAAAILHSLKTSPPIPQTMTEKIIQKHAVDLPPNKIVQSGDFVFIRPHHCMTHDNSAPVITKFLETGATKVFDKKQLVLTLDHDVQNKTEGNLKKYRKIEEFAKQQGIVFYGAGRGIGHQIMVEEGYARCGTMCVASDSHSNMYGALACVGLAIVRTDAAGVWARGQFWLNIPPVARVNLTGQLPRERGVSGKDVIIALCSLFGRDEVLNHAVEFTFAGPETAESLPVEERLPISNMTTEWGALTGLFPMDNVLQRWLRSKATEKALYGRAGLDESSGLVLDHARIDELFSMPVTPDKGAKYAKQFHLNLSSLSPWVSGPNSVKVANPLRKLVQKRIPIQKAFLVSCTNSRASDIASAAQVFRRANDSGTPARVADGVSMYVSAASKPEQLKAEASGDWQVLTDAGARPLVSGCGPCIGLGTGLLEANETGISASNRNFKGRMGSPDAQAYLASPEVVAASALAGHITGPAADEQDFAEVEFGPGDGIKEEDRMITAEEALDKIIGQLDQKIESAESKFGAKEVQEEETELTDILPGFPEKIQGEILWLDVDNLNTDGIYPGRYTYEDGITREKMAEVVMENYDKDFASIAQKGDIIVAGKAFGVGSSREQAATALLARGIPVVIAESISGVFARNGINNGLLNSEIPRLVHRLRATFSSSHTTPSQSIKEPSMNKDSLDSPPPAPPAVPEKKKALTRRTGWTLTWDFRASRVEVQEGPNGQKWSQKVGMIPPNVQDILASGGLEKWIKKEIEKER